MFIFSNLPTDYALFHSLKKHSPTFLYPDDKLPVLCGMIHSDEPTVRRNCRYDSDEHFDSVLSMNPVCQFPCPVCFYLLSDDYFHLVCFAAGSDGCFDLVCYLGWAYYFAPAGYSDSGGYSDRDDYLYDYPDVHFYPDEFEYSDDYSHSDDFHDSVGYVIRNVHSDVHPYGDVHSDEFPNGHYG